MAMEDELRALLRADAAVLTAAQGRVNWGAHPQASPWPGVVLSVVSDREGYHAAGRDGLSVARVQADCYAASYTAARTLARAVRACLTGHRGGAMRAVFHEASRDMGREEGASEEARPFRVSDDFMIHWRTT